MSRDPYFRVFPGDFLGGIVDLEGDEIGAYWVCILLMHDRGGPIPDDPAWIARRAGVHVRRWHNIRAKLIRERKLKVIDGQLGNPRALREIAKRIELSDTRRSAALARWHDDAPEFDLGDEFGESGDNSLTSKKRRKTAESEHANALPSKRTKTAENRQSGDANACANPPKSRAKKSATSPQVGRNIDFCRASVNEQKPQKSAETTNANACKDSRARSRPRVQSLESNERAPSSPPRARGARPPAREAEPSAIETALASILRASGFHPTSPGHLAKAREFVQAWLDLGIDIEGLAIPIIERIIAEAPDKTTGSLARFDKLIRAEHAAAAARAKRSGRGDLPLASPSTSAGTDDDDPRLAQIRADLRRDTGARTYEAWLAPMSMTLDGSVLIVALPTQFLADWLLTHFAERFKLEAKRHGFTEIRIGTNGHKPP